MTYTGLWWLPATPNRKIFGTLQVGADGMMLETTGTLVPKTQPFDMGGDAYNIVHGATQGSNNITLYYAITQGGSWSANGISITRYCVQAAILGHLFSERIEKLRWTELRAECTQLAEWIGISGFQDPDVTFIEGIQCKIDYTLPPKEVLYQTETENWSVQWSVQLPGRSSTQRKMSIGETPYFCVTIPRPRPFGELNQQVHQFRKLLSCWVGAPVAITSLSSIFEKQEVRFLWRNFVDPQSGRSVHSYHQLAPYAEIRAWVSPMIAQYRAQYETVGPILELWDILRFQTELSQEQRFLHHCQILEAFHRRTVGGTDRSPGEHDKRITAILEATPKEFRKWLKWKLSNSNQHFFGTRLAYYWDTAFWVTQSPEERECFVEKIVKARNYFTHYSPEEKEPPPQHSDLIDWDFQLETLFTITLLRWLGLPDDFLRQKVGLLLHQMPHIIAYKDGTEAPP